MPEIAAVIVKSLMYPELLSIRGEDGHVGTLRRQLAENFEAGDLVTISLREKLDVPSHRRAPIRRRKR